MLVCRKVLNLFHNVFQSNVQNWNGSGPLKQQEIGQYGPFIVAFVSGAVIFVHKRGSRGIVMKTVQET